MRELGSGLGLSRGSVLPHLPDGYMFSLWADGSFELDADGNYVFIEKVD